MPAQRLDDEVARATADAYRLHDGNASAAADSLGIKRTTFNSRLKVAAERGMLGTDPVMPGFAIRQVTTKQDAEGETKETIVQQRKASGPEFELTPELAVAGKTTWTNAEGRITQQVVMERRAGKHAVDIIEALKTAFDGIEIYATPTPAPIAPAADLLTLTPCNDWHVGMFAWGKETEENWDLKIAEEVIGRAVDDLVDRSPSSAIGVVLGGGDLLHADNSENRTARSGNALDVDGRYQKVLRAACRLKVRTVDAHLRRHAHVIVRILPGNHDEHTAIAVAYFLLAWYRNEPRVTVDVDPSLFWWHRFGAVMLGATHGHSVKLKAMPGIMACRRAEDWGATRYRYVHGFHIHHKELHGWEEHGVIGEAHQAPIPQDAYHFGAGFLSGRSLQSITYHRDEGEVSRIRVGIRKRGAA